MAMQLFGVGEAALHRLLSSLIKPMARIGHTAGIDAILGVLPDVAGHMLCVVGTARAFRQTRAVATHTGIAAVVAIAMTVGGGVDQILPFGTTIGVGVGLIGEGAFGQIALELAEPTVTNDAVKPATLEPRQMATVK